MYPNLVGGYHIADSNLVKSKEPLHLVVCRRRKPTPQKPPFYLLHRHTPTRHTYLSSLYPLGEIEAQNHLQGYSMEVGGVCYLLMLDQEAGTAQISVLDRVPKREAATNGL